MAWWRRRGRGGGAVVAAAPHAGRHRAGSWAEPALPPAAPEPPVAVAPLPRVGPAVVEPAVVEPAAAVAGVRLGFADGSEVELDAAHPSARALRAVADLIVQEDGVRAENSPGSASASRRVRWRQAAAEGP